MADASIFAQYLKPVKSVAEYQDEGDARTLSRLKLLLGQQEAQQKQQGFADDAKFRGLTMQYGNDQTGLLNALRSGGLYGKAKDIESGIATIAEQKAKTDKTSAEAKKLNAGMFKDDVTQAASAIFANPDIEGAKAAVIRIAQKHGQDPTPDLNELAQITDATQLQRWAAGKAMSVEKLLPKTQTTNAGGQQLYQSVNPITGQVTQTGQDTITESEAQRLSRERQEAQAAAKLAQDAKQFSAQHGQRQKFHDEKLGADKAAVGKIEWKQDTDGSWVALPKEVKDGTPVTPIRTTLPGKKEVQSGHAIDIINEARGLVDQATGSFVGAGVDFAGRTVGASTGGAIATGKLKALEGSLMMAQPRMEGPQSDKDVALYRQMAGQIGDPTVQREVKKAALDTIENLHRKYATNAPGAAPKPAGGPKPIKNDADYNALPSGAEFIGPDGKTRRKP